MQLSTLTRYGMRAITRLGIIAAEENRPVSVREIAETENISIKYLEN